MRKILVLIAATAVAYGLVGAAASKLTVSQSVIPAQGSVSEGVLYGCTPAVTVSYVAADDAGTTQKSLASGEARQITAILVTPIYSGTPACTTGDLLALSFSATDPVPDDVTGDGPDPLTFPNTARDWLAEGDLIFTGTTLIDAEMLSNEDAITTNGGWLFNLASPALIEDFDPGSITVTLWREPAPDNVP